MPSALPWSAGLTTMGKASRSSIASSASAAPSSRNAVSVKAKKSGVGSPASRIACLAATLSMHRMQPDTPEPVYGIPSASSSS
jgi:hypothetical protein